MTFSERVFTIDSHGIITSFNRSLEKLFGYHSTEMVGENITEIFPSFMKLFTDMGYIDFTSHGEFNNVIGKQRNGADLTLKVVISEIKLANRTVYSGFVHNLLN